MIRFQSDNYEFTGTVVKASVNKVNKVGDLREATGNSKDVGFKLPYTLDNTVCFTPS